MKNVSMQKSEVVFCHNLCRDDNNPEVFRPVAPPSLIGAPKDGVGAERVVPLTYAGQDDVVVTSAEGTSVLDVSTGVSRMLTSEPVMCACRVGDDRLVAVCDGGPLLFERNDKGLYSENSGGYADWPPVSIMAVESAPLSMAIDSVTTAAMYNPGDNVSASDRERLIEAVNTAYGALCAEADRQGVAFQPVMARAVIKDSRGEILFRGPEVLVMPPQGLPFDSPVQLPFADRKITEPTTVAVPTYRLRVVAHPSPVQAWAERAATLELELSPFFHPCATSAPRSASQVTVMRSGMQSDVVVSVTMPGSAYALSTYDSTLSERLVNAVASGFDTMSMPLHIAAKPYERGCDLVVGLYGMPSPEEQAAAIQRALKARIHVSPETAVLNAPHTFRARHAVSTPKAVSYADIETLPYAGYSVADYASATDPTSGPWAALTRTTYADGTVSVRRSRGERNKPLKLTPLIVCPDPEAVSVEITVEDEGAPRSAVRWRTSLKRDASGRCALSVAAGLAQREPAVLNDSISGPAESVRRPGRRMQSAVAVASASNPLTIKTVCDTGSSVTAIVRAVSTSGAWDFGRIRFYAFNTDKVSLVNVSADLRTVAAGVLATAGVESAASVAAADTAPTCFVTRTGYVYSLSGTRATILAKLPEGMDVLGFDPCGRRLVAASTVGSANLYHISLATGRLDMTTDSPGAVYRTLGTTDRLLASTARGLADMTIRPAAGDEPVNVRLIGTVAVPQTARTYRLRSATWDIDAERFDGSLSLERCSQSGRGATTTSYTVRGRLASPVTMPVSPRPSRRYRLEINGDVSPDATVSAPLVSYRAVSHG